MQKYQFMANTAIVKNYDGLLYSINTSLGNCDRIKSFRMDFEGKSLYFKIFSKTKKQYATLHIALTGFQIKHFDKETNELLNTETHGYVNFTDVSMIAIFNKKILPRIQLVLD